MRRLLSLLPSGLAAAAVMTLASLVPASAAGPAGPSALTKAEAPTQAHKKDVRRRHLHDDEVRYRLRRHGYSGIRIIKRYNDILIVEARDRRGNFVRLRIDAYTGEVLSFSIGIGGRDRYKDRHHDRYRDRHYDRGGYKLSNHELRRCLARRGYHGIKIKDNDGRVAEVVAYTRRGVKVKLKVNRYTCRIIDRKFKGKGHHHDPYYDRRKRDKHYRDRHHRDRHYRDRRHRDKHYRDRRHRDKHYRDRRHRDKHYRDRDPHKEYFRDHRHRDKKHRDRRYRGDDHRDKSNKHRGYRDKDRGRDYDQRKHKRDKHRGKKRDRKKDKKDRKRKRKDRDRHHD